MTTTGGALPLPRPEQIPAELRSRDNWVCYRKEPRPGETKPTKVPYTPNTSGPRRKAKAGDPRTWAAFTRADFALRHAEGFDGLGYQVTPPYFLVDLDGERDPDTGELTPFARSVVALLGTHTHPSISGSGIHLIGKGTPPPGLIEDGKSGKKRGGREIYFDRRFVAWGHEPLPGHEEIREINPDTMLQLFALLFPAEPASTRGAAPAAALPPLDLDAAAVLDEARADRLNGAKFRRLFDQGDKSDYPDKDGNPDDSDADLGLCSLLAYWFRNDRDAVDQAFRRSALMRPKWERADYRSWTLTRACNRNPAWDGVLRATAPAPRPFCDTFPPVEAAHVGDSPRGEAAEASAAPEPTPIHTAPSADPLAELARLRAENADLRRQLGECSRRREMEVAHWRERCERERAEKAAIVRDQRIFREALRNQDCKAEVRGGLAVALQIREQMNNHPEQYAVRDRETGEQFWIVNYSMAGRQVGLSSDQVGKAVKLLARQGKLRTKRLRTRGPRRNPDTGEVEEGYITPICISIDADPMEWVARELAPLEKAPDPETGEVKKHGGKRCPRCGSGKTRVVTRICLDCGHQFAGDAAAEAEDDPDAALNPHLAGLEETPAPVVVVPIGPQDADLEPAPLNRQDAGSGRARPLPRCLSVSRGCENRVERAGDEYCPECVRKGYRNPPRGGDDAAAGGYQAAGD